MRTILTVRKFFLLFLFVAAVAACKKTETITVEEPVACFSTLIIDPFDSYQRTGNVASLDSTFYFRNCSDSGVDISYRWNFGDGVTSNERNPKHSYPKRGSYKVTLVVSNRDIAFDTIRQTVSVQLGQQDISINVGQYLAPVAIEETASNEFTLLAVSDYGSLFHLYKLDSLLKQISVKNFPSTYQLSSMKSTPDGNYVFTGSIQDATKMNELIKMTPDGNVLWSKAISPLDRYIYASPMPDGGYAVVGARTVAGPYGNMINYGVVIKTDNNGNSVWQKVLDQESMINVGNAVVEQDGIVLAGVKKANGGPCWECDSLLIVKLNNAGNIVWKNTVLWGLNTTNWWNTNISKLSNGNYAVNNEYTRGIFTFSSAGNFLDRKLAGSQVRSVVSSADGNLIVLQSEWGNGNRINIAKMAPDGTVIWNAYPEGRQKMGTSVRCCATSWPVAMRPLRNGGVMVIGNRYLANPSSYHDYSVILLLQLDEAGKPK